MNGVFVASIIATTLVLLFALTFNYFRKYKINLNCIYISILLLPMCYIAYTFIRIPFDNIIKNVYHISAVVPKWYYIIFLLYAPIIEEFAKVIPLFIPFIRKSITKENYILYGLTSGLSFGIGEMWFLANIISNSNFYTNLHWYHFNGFIYERILSSICHACLTTIVYKYTIKNKMYKGIMIAMTLHGLLNLPIILVAGKFIILSKAIYENFMMIYILIFTILISTQVLFANKFKGDSLT